MKRITGWIAAVVVALAVPAFGQTDTFPGKVIIGSTAADALTVAGGVVAPALKATVVDTSVGTVPIVATFERTGATGTATSRGVAIAFADANNPTLTGAIVGLRPDSSANFNGDLAFFLATGGVGTPATSLTAGMTRRLTITSAGQLLGTVGTSAAPTLATNADVDSGVNITAGQVDIVTDGIAAMTFAGYQAQMLSRDNGTGTGRALTIGRNNNGTTPAAGSLSFIESDGGASSIWVDATGVLRLGANPPSSAGGVGDTAGTIVGTQTSSRASKVIVGEVVNTAAAMAVIRATPVYEFRYRNGAYGGERFFGIVTDDSPLFGMDRGQSFNPVTAFGATVLALRDADARIAALEARLAALEARK